MRCIIANFKRKEPNHFALDTRNYKLVDSYRITDADSDYVREGIIRELYICPNRECACAMTLKKINERYYFAAKNRHAEGCQYDKSGNSGGNIHLGSHVYEIDKMLNHIDSETEPIPKEPVSKAVKKAAADIPFDPDSDTGLDDQETRITSLKTMYADLMQMSPDDTIYGDVTMDDLLVNHSNIRNKLHEDLSDIRVIVAKRWGKIPESLQQYVRNGKYIYLVDESGGSNVKTTLHLLVKCSAKRIDDKFREMIFNKEASGKGSQKRIVLLANWKKVPDSEGLVVYKAILNSKCFLFTDPR